MKKNATALVAASAMEQLRQIDGRCEYLFTWFEPTRRRDPDNIAFAKKFIFDGLIQAGIIKGDGWKQVAGFADRFQVDHVRGPYVEVIIRPGVV